MDSGTERPGSANYYRLTAAAQLVGMPPSRVRRYLKVGLVRAEADERGAPVLGAAELARLRRIRRLTNDLGLNMPGVEVVLRLLDEIDTLRAGIDRSRPPQESSVFGLLGSGDTNRRGQR
ncbi:MAG: MerR family transcriptional regulator, heat shock protein HspR [Thermomicrobiales bacterium]|jgi:MerR family transcriptional regulator/heat shock protein HspR|nr:MerR family transcriptional regulator, heat shock protein HspR [Thermomicrobiales bacterium]MEA2523151.1 MerR family transcriptional regulator, heat shock protein HspR [Thermomicrobiales bacterium]MEA2584092.1 MerR family transcriptional regulator, heat shock protein HspR [Thermomicrobiales bacterium]MEA2595244.1 MerR family transcriptional regulator, heat shock protein HspR [Thermomicrobiales bacterium]